MNKVLNRIFVTGIDTDVGKTLVSAVICEALQADYWKPIQAGESDKGDKYTVKKLLTNHSSSIHPNSYTLQSPMSLHASAQRDGIKIDLKQIVEPKTNNTLVIEGAGGLLVPLNDTQTILDIIKPNYHVILVSQHYLGSINHTLMTLKILQDKGFDCSIIFNGVKNPSTEQIIKKMTHVKVIGRINKEDKINKNIILKYAQLFKQSLEQL